MRTLYFCRSAILFLVLCNSLQYSRALYTLVLNALGDKPSSCAVAIKRIVTTIEALVHPTNSTAPNFHRSFSHRVMFVRQDAYGSLSADMHSTIKKLELEVKFYKSKPLADRNIGRPVKITEFVSYILESLFVTAQTGSDIVALSFTDRSIPMLTNNSHHAISFMESFGIQVLLLGKNRRMSSVSDWHDLQIMALRTSNSSVIEWLDIVNRTYMHHADRPAYTMLEPRPALMEAKTQLLGHVLVDYFPDMQVCAVEWISGEHTHQHAHDFEPFPDPRYMHSHHLEHFHDRRCEGDTNMFEIMCGTGHEFEDHVCAITGDPIGWKAGVGGPTKHLFQKLGLQVHELSTKLPNGMDKGSLRYRLAKDKKNPAGFCWDTGSDSDAPKRSKIYENWDKTRPFGGYNVSLKAKAKVAIITADHGSWASIDSYLFETLGKIYYAKRHGYKFGFQFSNQLVNYFPHDLFSAVGRSDPYFKGVMSKTLITLDAMHRYHEEEWILFTDSDAWINAEWLDMPIDAILQDVPDDKLWIQTNYRSMLTGIFLVRNNAAGRQLVRDWLAVGMSGQVSCHGFDQAAIMIVFMLRQSKVFSERPFGLSCLSNDIVDPITGLNGTGCSGADWSCDYKFERVMNKMGFRTQRNSYFSDSFSSYSRGCANDYVNDFHVSYETAYRPRLQCFHCGKTYEVESLEWDGPLGGGNEKVRSGAVNSYFTNHKATWLFYEQYLNASTCKKMDFLDPCDVEITKYHEEIEDNTDEGAREALYGAKKHGRILVSLVEGIAVDLHTGQFCKLDPLSKTFERQWEFTYMKDYEKFISIAHDYTEKKWKEIYMRVDGQARSACDKNKIDAGECGEDGQNWQPKKDNWFLAKSDVCSACKITNNTFLDPSGKRMAVDCFENY